MQKQRSKRSRSLDVFLSDGYRESEAQPLARLIKRLAQGVSLNDSTMPGFNTACLSRPLLASRVATVIP